MAKNAGTDGLTPWHKIAVLMIALGQEGAGELMQHFGEDEVAQVAQAITDLKNVPSDLQNAVLREFEDALQGGAPALGGVEFACSLLEQAIGPEKATAMLGSATDGEVSAFQLLRDVDPSQVAPSIAQEHPQTVALILSQADPPQAAAILEELPALLQVEVVQRIATLGHIAPDILEEVEQMLRALLKDVMGGKREVGGSQVVADILNEASGGLEKSVLARIDAADPEVAEAIRNRMFVFDDLASLADAEMQTVVHHIEIKDLQISLKSASKGVRDRFFTAMSERARGRLLEDMDALPPMRLSEVEEAQVRIVQQVRQLEEQQIIRLPRGGVKDDYV